MELYKKHRPQTLKEMAGNTETVNSLATLLEMENLPHSILLTGPKGCGKTTLGRILKNELGCRDFDYKEMDTAVFRGIDTVRDIRKQMGFSPVQSPCRIWLLDECHQLGVGGDSSKNAAQNGLLKALEDTPKHVYFILCTTNPEMLLSTIRSRCVKFEVNPLAPPTMFGLLKKVLKKEGKELSKPVLQKIAKCSEGSPRNALQLTEKVMHLTDEKEMLHLIQSEAEQQTEQVYVLCKALIDMQKWSVVLKILKGLKTEDPESVRRGIIGIAGAFLLNGNGAASRVLGWFLYKNTFDCGFPLITQFCFNIIHEIEPPL